MDTLKTPKGIRGIGPVGHPREKEIIYTYRYTVTTRMTSALRWAAKRAILMFQLEVMDKVTGHGVHKPQPF